MPEPDVALKICALAAQAELGDATGMPCQINSYLLISPICNKDSEFDAKNQWLVKVFQQHQTLKVCLLSNELLQ